MEGHTLSDMAVSIEEFEENRCFFINSSFYITRQINHSLDRILSIFGVDIHRIFSLLNDTLKVKNYLSNSFLLNNVKKNRNIEIYFKNDRCIICKAKCGSNVIQT